MSDELKRRIEQALRSSFTESEDFVYARSGDDPDNIHVVVISPKFAGLRLKEKQALVWDQLTASLRPDDWQHITLALTVTPEELSDVLHAM
ncbi:MAG: hypothetical protein WD894_23985 [Pirellulales bacterium]